jgi:hypothetical protein
MILELTHDEEQALRALLDRDLSNMYAEISHTDNPTFRAGLREERALLRAVRERLTVAREVTGVDA